MNKKTGKLLIVLIFTLFAVKGLSQQVTWGKMLGSDKDEYVLNHVLDKSGNIFISGKTEGEIGSRNLGHNDGFLMKLDSAGNIQWKEQFGTPGDEDVQWSAIDDASNIYITGSTTGDLSGKNLGKQDIILVKYGPDGEKAFTVQTGTDSVDVAKGICIDKAGNVYITGYTSGKLGSKSFGKSDCFILKANKNGKITKTVQFGTLGDDMSYSVMCGPDGDVYVCGTTWGALGEKAYGMVDGFAGHFTANLESPEFYQFGTDGFDIPLVLHTTTNGLLIGGSTSGDFGGKQAGDGDCFLLSIGADGKVIWKNQFGTDHNDAIRGIDLDEKSGKIFVSGIMNLPPERAFIRAYSNQGQLLSERSFEGAGNTGKASGKDVVVDHNGSLTHLGLTGTELFGPMIGMHDIFIVKLHQ